jgi:hypothetical protein
MLTPTDSPSSTRMTIGLAALINKYRFLNQLRYPSAMESKSGGISMRPGPPGFRDLNSL